MKAALSLLFAALACAAPVAAQQRKAEPASTIIDMERRALDQMDNSKPDGFVGVSAPDVVYIDPSLAQPIAGLKALGEYYKGFPQDANPGRMENVRVQMLGEEVVVLTYNYLGQRALRDGWNCTEVYCKTPQGWRIEHTHWSYVKSQPVAHE